MSVLYALPLLLESQPPPPSGVHPNSRTDDTLSFMPMARSDEYSPGPSVTQLPRKYASSQSCQRPLRTVADDALSLNPLSLRFDTL